MTNIHDKHFNIKSIEFETYSVVKFKQTNAKLVYTILILILQEMINKYNYITTIDINNFFNKYEKKYCNFKFLGAVPLNFFDLDTIISIKNKNFKFKNINFQMCINNGIHEFFVVINSEPSYLSGRHWTSLYFNFVKNQIYFHTENNRINTLILKNSKYKPIFNYIKIIEQLMKKNNSQVSVIF